MGGNLPGTLVIHTRANFVQDYMTNITQCGSSTGKVPATSTAR